MAQYKSKEWLEEELKANGMTLQDLSDQTGISLRKLEKLTNSDEGDKEVWNTVLTELNSYPSLDYPSASILEDLQNDMNQVGPEAECTVYYGVDSGDLIFTDYKLPGRGLHGANQTLEFLAALHITLEEAYELFEKQNLTL